MKYRIRENGEYDPNDQYGCEVEQDWEQEEFIGCNQCGCSPVGPTGPTGPVGPVGPAGPTGPAGAIGPIGPVGAQGPGGIAGPTGAKGDKGDKGDTGAIGPVGATGPKGDMGLMGPQGAVGPIGAQGAVGPAGPEGRVGPVGPVGPQGPQGAQGAQGPAGNRGVKGDTGPMGPRGPKGSITEFAELFSDIEEVGAGCAIPFTGHIIGGYNVTHEDGTGEVYLQPNHQYYISFNTTAIIENTNSMINGQIGVAGIVVALDDKAIKNTASYGSNGIYYPINLSTQAIVNIQGSRRLLSIKNCSEGCVKFDNNSLFILELS